MTSYNPGKNQYNRFNQAIDIQGVNKKSLCKCQKKLVRPVLSAMDSKLHPANDASQP
jgi:hypothetical protein